MIRPCVIRAHDGTGVAGAFKQSMGAMSADIEERPQFIVIRANDKNALVCDIQREVVTYLGDVALVSDVMPGFGKNRFFFLLEDVWVCVKSGRHGVTVGGIIRERFVSQGDPWRGSHRIRLLTSVKVHEPGSAEQNSTEISPLTRRLPGIAIG